MIGSAAQAGLVLDLRFPDGSLTKNISSASAGAVFDIDVWMTVTGTAAGEEGFNAAYFGLMTNPLTPHVVGDLGKGSQPDNYQGGGFSSGLDQDAGPLGSIQKDGMKDWAGNALNSSTNWPKASVGAVPTYLKIADIDNTTPGTKNPNLPKGPGAVVPDGVSFMVARVPFTLSSIGSSLPATLTDSLEIVPVLPTSLLASLRATWLQDGATATPSGTKPYTAGTSVKFSVQGAGGNPDIDADKLLVDLGPVLKGVALPTDTVVLSNVGTLAGDYTTQAIGLGDVISGGAGNIGIGGTANLVVSLKNAGGPPNGLKTGTVHVDVPDSDPDGDFDITVQATIGQAAPGQEVKAQIQAGGTYKGIGLSVAPGQGALGTSADLLGGTSDGGPVSFKFLTVADNNGSLPPSVGLISDILDLSTDDDGTIEPFVLAMTYQESLLAGLGKDEAKIARAGFIFLGWQDGQVWVNAVDGNTAGEGQFMGVGAVPDFTGADLGAMLGQWGIDINTNTVWAVLNHNSRFAVLPEPATFGLLGLGAMGLLARRRRA